jgi:hypothetical protein
LVSDVGAAGERFCLNFLRCVSKGISSTEASIGRAPDIVLNIIVTREAVLKTYLQVGPEFDGCEIDKIWIYSLRVNRRYCKGQDRDDK